MVTVPLVVENLSVYAIMITLEQTVQSEIFVYTIYANIIQHVLLVSRIIHAIAQRVFMENIVSKLTIVPVVHVKILEFVAIMRQVFYANAEIISLVFNAKRTTSVLVKVVTDTESVRCRTMDILVTVLWDTVARIAKSLIIVLVSFVAIMGRALMETVTILANAKLILWERTVI